MSREYALICDKCGWSSIKAINAPSTVKEERERIAKMLGANPNLICNGQMTSSQIYMLMMAMFNND